MLSTTEETLDAVFSAAAGRDSGAGKDGGAIERVKKLKDYAFIHFKDRADALQALQNLNGP